jgi:hypothetical protein
MRLIPKNTLVNLGLKKYSQEWLALVSKLENWTLEVQNFPKSKISKNVNREKCLVFQLII